MFLKSALIASFSTLLVTSAVEAQRTINFYWSQYRGSGYDRAIGNGWLGGSVHAHAYLQTTTGAGYERGSIDVDARASVNLLQHSMPVAEVASVLSNTMQYGNQTRAGSFRVTLLGYNYVNQSFTNDSQFAQQTWAFNVFPVAPSASIPVGPFSVTVSGNAGASLTVSANFFLPAATPSVTLAGSGRIYGNATASVSVGVPGFHVGVGIQGRVCDTTMTAWAAASPRTGFTGIAQVSLTAISLRLYAFLDTIFHTWTTDLCTWSSAALIQQLM